MGHPRSGGRRSAGQPVLPDLAGQADRAGRVDPPPVDAVRPTPCVFPRGFVAEGANGVRSGRIGCIPQEFLQGGIDTTDAPRHDLNITFNTVLIVF